LGFSLGGHICLRLRAQASVLAVFFAPELQGLGSPTLGALHAQIHHGLADTTVPFTDAQRIDGLLKAEGAISEAFFYEGASHGFVGNDAHNATARRDSKDRAISLFARNL
jgi:dienelactone hydrolase